MMRYVGPAARTAHSAATLQPNDIIDLIEPALWQTNRCRSDIHLLGPALVVLYGCCGVTPYQATLLTEGDFRPLGRDCIFVPESKGSAEREIPLIPISKLKLQMYVTATKINDDSAPLFKTKDGNALRVNSIQKYFSSLGGRISLDGMGLPKRLQLAFQRWMDACPTEQTRIYLRGESLVDLGIKEPSPNVTKRAIELAHPLAALGRSALREGAVARAFPQPYFPALSRNALSDIAGLRRTTGQLTTEALRAIQIALRSGKAVQEVSAHYGISVGRINIYIRDGFPHQRPKLMGQPSTRRAVASYLRSNPSCTFNEYFTWLTETLKVRTDRQYAVRKAKDWGFELLEDPRPTKARDAFERAWPEIEKAIAEDPVISNIKIAEVVEQLTGVRISEVSAWRFMKGKGELTRQKERRGRRPRR